MKWIPKAFPAFGFFFLFMWSSANSWPIEKNKTYKNEQIKAPYTAGFEFLYSQLGIALHLYGRNLNAEHNRSSFKLNERNRRTEFWKFIYNYIMFSSLFITRTLISDKRKAQIAETWKGRANNWTGNILSYKIATIYQIFMNLFLTELSK